MKLQFGTEQQAGIHPGTAEKLDRLACRWIDTGFTTSVAYLAAHRGVIFAYGAKGLRVPGDPPELLQPDTIFPIASITKVLTGIAIFLLTEEGLVSPTRPVQEFIPEFKGDGKNQVLIHHLLTHTSGIRDEDLWNQIKPDFESTQIPEEYARLHPHLGKYFYMGCSAPLWKAPGEEMSYSGFGIGIAGEIVVRVSGMSLDAFFRERIFGPLAMKDSYLSVPDELDGRIIVYPENAIFKSLNGLDHRKNQSASGGAYSTAYDLALMGQMFLDKGMHNDRRFLSRASVDAMTRNQTKGIISHYGDKVFKESGWGLPFGLSLDKTDETGTLRSPQAFSHGGAGCTMLFIDPVYEVVATCMMVSMDFGDGILVRKFDNYLNTVIAGVL